MTTQNPTLPPKLDADSVHWLTSVAFEPHPEQVYSCQRVIFNNTVLYLCPEVYPYLSAYIRTYLETPLSTDRENEERIIIDTPYTYGRMDRETLRALFQLLFLQMEPQWEYYDLDQIICILDVMMQFAPEALFNIENTNAPWFHRYTAAAATTATHPLFTIHSSELVNMIWRKLEQKYDSLSSSQHDTVNDHIHDDWAIYMIVEMFFIISRYGDYLELFDKKSYEDAWYTRIYNILKHTWFSYEQQTKKDMFFLPTLLSHVLLTIVLHSTTPLCLWNIVLDVLGHFFLWDESMPVIKQAFVQPLRDAFEIVSSIDWSMYRGWIAKHFALIRLPEQRLSIPLFMGPFLRILPQSPNVWPEPSSDPNISSVLLQSVKDVVARAQLPETMTQSSTVGISASLDIISQVMSSEYMTQRIQALQSWSMVPNRSQVDEYLHQVFQTIDNVQARMEQSFYEYARTCPRLLFYQIMPWISYYKSDDFMLSIQLGASHEQKNIRVIGTNAQNMTVHGDVIQIPDYQIPSLVHTFTVDDIEQITFPQPHFTSILKHMSIEPFVTEKWSMISLVRSYLDSHVNKSLTTVRRMAAWVKRYI